jgi:poly(3-hydroxybutyrate) depolymerase
MLRARARRGPLAGAAFGSALAAQGGRVGREMMATWEMIGRTGLTHTGPDYGITSVRVGNREVAVSEVATHVTPFGTLLHFRKDIDGPAEGAAGGAAVRPFRHAAAQHGRTLLPTTTSTSPTGTTPATCRWTAGRFGFDEYVEHLIASSRRSGRARTSSPCASPACRRWPPRGHGAGRQSRPAAQHDPDGRARRYAVNPTKVNELATEQADRVVREAT